MAKPARDNRQGITFFIRDLISARDTVLVNDAVRFAALTHDLIDLLRVNADVLILSGRVKQ